MLNLVRSTEREKKKCVKILLKIFISRLMSVNLEHRGSFTSSLETRSSLMSSGAKKGLIEPATVSTARFLRGGEGKGGLRAGFPYLL